MVAAAGCLSFLSCTLPITAALQLHRPPHKQQGLAIKYDGGAAVFAFSEQKFVVNAAGDLSTAVYPNAFDMVIPLRLQLPIFKAVAHPGFPVGGGAEPLGGHQPPMWALFGKNVCENERIGSCWGVAHRQHPPRIHQCKVQCTASPLSSSSSYLPSGDRSCSS